MLRRDMKLLRAPGRRAHVWDEVKGALEAISGVYAAHVLGGSWVVLSGV